MISLYLSRAAGFLALLGGRERKGYICFCHLLAKDHDSRYIILRGKIGCHFYPIKTLKSYLFEVPSPSGIQASSVFVAIYFFQSKIKTSAT